MTCSSNFVLSAAGWWSRLTQQHSQTASVELAPYQLDTEPHLHERMCEIEQFRYRIYIEELGKQLPHANHAEKRLPDSDDPTGAHIVARGKDELITGYARVHLGSDIPERYVSLMHATDFVRRCGCTVAYGSKLMIEKSLRGGLAGLQMMEEMVNYGRRTSGDLEVALFHCNPKLLRFYEALGLRTFNQPFHDPYVGMQIPMYFMLGDVDHFAAVQSPLLRVARQKPIDPEVKLRLLSLLSTEVPTHV